VSSKFTSGSCSALASFSAEAMSSSSGSGGAKKVSRHDFQQLPPFREVEDLHDVQQVGGGLVTLSEPHVRVVAVSRMVAHQGANLSVWSMTSHCYMNRNSSTTC
jgi:hypothetical protein